ncbi:hypothetical protein A6A04_01190 [Paramagnetospirillum marisnigri]|uniref:DNA polymerase III n=1 Tax=Paramagnetospirillum marisnigri TaxID=1285242 RepID=A0A178MU39_9PROT|nr:hypothetical protein [Paramagnetospirillum marisnigri]OAN52337.1 hypothetical protein A6A04_01190 [Paramagnetospirillum marisnigri]
MTSSAIPPAPPPTPVPATVSSPPVLTVVVGSGAEALAKLPAGALVTAALDAVAARGLVQVTTADGTTLSLRLPPSLTLPPQADLGLQLTQAAGGGFAFKLLSVNGRPFGTPPLAAGLPGLPQLPGLADLLNPGAAKAGGMPQPMGRGDSVALGQPQPSLGPGGASAAPLGLTATVLRPAPAGATLLAPGQTPGGQAAAPPPGLADLVPGTQLTVRIAGVVPPGGGAPLPLLTDPGAKAGMPQPSPPNPAMPETPAEAAKPFAPPPSHGEPTGLRPPPTQTPGQTPQAPGGAMPPPIPQSSSQAPTPSQPTTPIPLPGTVVSHSPGGTALVQTPAGLLSLPGGPSLAVGSGLRLEVMGAPAPPPAPLSASDSQGLTQGGWPALDSAVDTLMQMDRAVADQLVRMIPQANPRLAAALSVFAGAVRSGDVRAVMGEGVTRGLDRAGRRDLAERLKKDMLELSDQAQRPRGDGDWQVLTMPFAYGAQVDPIHLYVQRVSGDEAGQGGKKGDEQRFILDVSMSRLGRIQFEGLVQKDAKRFDLIIRSDQPLESDIRRDISGIFAECAQLTGVKGMVGFQSGRGFVELPPADSPGTRIVV